MNRKPVSIIVAIMLSATGLLAQQRPVVSNDPVSGRVTLATADGGLAVLLSYKGGCSLRELKVRERGVRKGGSVASTGIQVGDRIYSSEVSESQPVIKISDNLIIVDSIRFGGHEMPVSEKWTFTVTGNAIRWDIERRYEKDGMVDDILFPCWEFDSMKNWDGAMLDNGGVAWNRFLANPGESYGTQAGSLVLWNRVNNNCLNIKMDDQPLMNRVATFSHRENGVYSIRQASSPAPVPTLHGMYRFRGRGEKIYGPFRVEKGTVSSSFTMIPAAYDVQYDRGMLKGIDEGAVNEMFNTIGRYGVVDRNLYGSNGWRTGWTVLQEPWLALFGLAIDAPEYVAGFTQALDYAAQHAVMPDGRVLPRWHHDSTDAMPGTFRPDGFYECQWGYMLDAQPAFAIDVAEQFDLTGDTAWLRRMKPVCENVLGYMARRDTDRDGLFEVIQKSWKEGVGTDWFDVVWASWEVASINAYMYNALDRWAGLEELMGDADRSAEYRQLAARLKTAFNKPVADGGFWDPEKQWYVHWREPDGRAYGSNLNTMVNFLAIGYGLCDDNGRTKAILGKTEELMLQEKLFIWPSCFFPYEEGVGLAGVNYPWPNYENGDLFLAWAELGTRSYAGLNPDIALKYIRNVIGRYEKDGLAHQRYTRVAQTGAGDDILSNNIMAVIGLYRNLYGIRPQWNRLLVDPHLPAELAGTQLKYNLRGKDYLIDLEKDKSTVRVDGWSLSNESAFAVNISGRTLEYFPGGSEVWALRITSGKPCEVEILGQRTEDGGRKTEDVRRKTLDEGVRIKGGRGKVRLEVGGLDKGHQYIVMVNGKEIRRLEADGDGVVRFDVKVGRRGETVSLR